MSVYGLADCNNCYSARRIDADRRDNPLSSLDIGWSNFWSDADLVQS